MVHLEAREKINVILYDFSNAFGTIYPPMLIKKLQKYGLNGSPLSWLESFLTNREQYVEIKDIDEKNCEKCISSHLLISDMGVRKEPNQLSSLYEWCNTFYLDRFLDFLC
jgi:hypothetical protein